MNVWIVERWSMLQSETYVLVYSTEEKARKAYEKIRQEDFELADLTTKAKRENAKKNWDFAEDEGKPVNRYYINSNLLTGRDDLGCSIYKVTRDEVN